MLKGKEISNTNLLLFGKHNETLSCLCHQCCSNESCFENPALTDLAKGSSTQAEDHRWSHFQGMENWPGNPSFPSFFLRIFSSILESHLFLDLKFLLWNISPVSISTVSNLPGWPLSRVSSKKQCDVWIWNFCCSWRQTFSRALHFSRFHPGRRGHQKQRRFHGDDCISSEWKYEAEARGHRLTPPSPWGKQAAPFLQRLGRALGTLP